MSASATTGRTGYAARLAVFSALPLVAGLAVAQGLYGDPRWWQLPPLGRDAVAGMTVAANAALLLIMCAAARPARRACYGVAMFIAISCGAAIVMSVRVPAAAWLSAHGMLAVTACAVVAGRFLAGRLFREPLDAAGLTVAVLAALTIGPLVPGPAAPPLPAWAIDAVLRLNPVVAVTSAAGMDLLHTSLFYRLAPVAHWQFEYPGTAASTALFGTTALLLAVIGRVLHHEPAA